MTPPFPSPPKTEFCSFISFTTFISPTDERTTVFLYFSQTLSNDMVVDKFVTKGVAISWVDKIPSAQMVRVYSSPSGIPNSSTTANRSPSGSVAKPTCALCFFTASPSCFKLWGNGSAPRGNFPFGVQLMVITSHPNASTICGNAIAAPPFTASTTTLNCRFRIDSMSTTDNWVVCLICKFIPLCSSVIVPTAPSSNDSASSANLNNRLFLLASRKQPSSSINFIPFHSVGL